MSLESPIEKKEMTLEQAVMIIGELKQRCAVLGSNDYEIPALDTLLEALNEGTCTPEEAVVVANTIVERKNDYH